MSPAPTDKKQELRGAEFYRGARGVGPATGAKMKKLGIF
jgi:hypothetical protein